MKRLAADCLKLAAKLTVLLAQDTLSPSVAGDVAKAKKRLEETASRLSLLALREDLNAAQSDKAGAQDRVVAVQAAIAQEQARLAALES